MYYRLADDNDLRSKPIPEAEKPGRHTPLRPEASDRFWGGVFYSLLYLHGHTLHEAHAKLMERGGADHLTIEDLAQWREWYQPRETLRQMRLGAENSKAIIDEYDTHGHVYEAALERMLIFKASQAASDPRADPRSIQTTVGTLIQYRKLRVAEETIQLKKLAFRRESGELLNKYLNDQRIKEAETKNFDNTEKIDLMGRILWGDWWKGVEGKTDHRYENWEGRYSDEIVPVGEREIPLEDLTDEQKEKLKAEGWRNPIERYGWDAMSEPFKKDYYRKRELKKRKAAQEAADKAEEETRKEEEARVAATAPPTGPFPAYINGVLMGEVEKEVLAGEPGPNDPIPPHLAPDLDSLPLITDKSKRDAGLIPDGKIFV